MTTSTIFNFSVKVALSVGHLASLYNYDMKEYSKAEQLYLRSIKIGRKLFGPSYSGLEYDYRGLIQVYHLTRNYEKFIEYQEILDQWRISREARAAEQVSRVVGSRTFFYKTFLELSGRESWRGKQFDDPDGSYPDSHHSQR